MEFVTPALKAKCIGAYSVRRLSLSYTGPVIRLRRSRDGDEQDFYEGNAHYFTRNSLRLSTWLGTSQAYVVTWYDQGGKNNHATQSIVTQQPLFVTHADWSPSIPTVRFDGVDDVLNFNGNGLVNTNYTVCATSARNSSKANNFFVSGTNYSTNNNLFIGFSAYGFAHNQFSNDYGMKVPGFTGLRVGAVASARHSTTLVMKNLHLDGEFGSSTANGVSLLSYSEPGIGRGWRGAFYDGDVTEFVMFAEYATDRDRSLLETKMGSFYKNEDSTPFGSRVLGAVRSWGEIPASFLSSNLSAPPTASVSTAGPVVTFTKASQQFFTASITPTGTGITANGGVTIVARVKFGVPLWYETICHVLGTNGGIIALNRLDGDSIIDFTVRDSLGFRVLRTALIVNGEWATFSARYNTSTNIMQIYKDGILKNSITAPFPAPPDTVLTKYEIGRAPAGDGWFDGDMTSVVVYDRHLSDAELTQVQTYCASAKGVGPLPSGRVINAHAARVFPSPALVFSTRNLTQRAGPLFELEKTVGGVTTTKLFRGQRHGTLLVSTDRQTPEQWLNGEVGYVNVWYDQGSMQKNAIGYASGSGVKPFLAKENGEYCVRVTTQGGYFNVGSTTWNIGINGGHSAIARIDLKSVVNFERVYDFSTNGGNGLLLSRLGTSSTGYRFGEYAPTQYQYVATVPTVDTKHTIAMRYSPTTATDVWNTWNLYNSSNVSVSTALSRVSANAQYVLANSYIGHPAYVSDMDIWDLVLYDEPVSNVSLMTLSSRLEMPSPVRTISATNTFIQGPCPLQNLSAASQTACVGAFGLRALSSTYGGPVARVARMASGAVTASFQIAFYNCTNTWMQHEYPRILGLVGRSMQSLSFTYSGTSFRIRFSGHDNGTIHNTLIEKLVGTVWTAITSNAGMAPLPWSDATYTSAITIQGTYLPTVTESVTIALYGYSNLIKLYAYSKLVGVLGNTPDQTNALTPGSQWAYFMYSGTPYRFQFNAAWNSYIHSMNIEKFVSGVWTAITSDTGLAPLPYSAYPGAADPNAPIPVTVSVTYFWEEVDVYAAAANRLVCRDPISGKIRDVKAWMAGSSAQVLVWYDQSGKGNHSIPETKTAYPTLSTANTYGNNVTGKWQMSFENNTWISVPRQIYSSYANVSCYFDIAGSTTNAVGSGYQSLLYITGTSNTEYTFGASKIAASINNGVYNVQGGGGTLSPSTVASMTMTRSTTRQLGFLYTRNTATVYVNGVLEGEGTMTNGTVFTPDANDVILIGGAPSGTSGVPRRMIADLRSFFFFNAPISAPEAAAISSVSYDTSLVASYDFRSTTSYSGSGSTVLDLSDLSRTLTFNSPPVFSATPRSVTLTPTHTAVSPLTTVNIFGSTPAFSVEVMFRVSEASPAGGSGGTINTIISYLTATNNSGITVGVTPERMVYIWMAYASPQGQNVVSTTVLALNTWYHAVITYSGAGGGDVYLNGNLTGKTTFTSVPGAYLVSNMPRYMIIGNVGITNSQTLGMNGSVALSKIYNRVFTAGEAAALYTQAKNLGGGYGLP